MKAYMIFSQEWGSQEVAVLGFANSVKEMKRVAWPIVKYDITDEYIDLGVRLLPNKEVFFQDGDAIKLENNIPHVVYDPTSCKRCEMWGGLLNEDGLCEGCQEDKDYE